MNAKEQVERDYRKAQIRRMTADGVDEKLEALEVEQDLKKSLIFLKWLESRSGRLTEPGSNNIEHRCVQLRAASDGKQKSYLVEGYASTFEPYVIMQMDGVDYKEKVMPDAFKNADMSDIVFRVDHEGKIYARTTAGTLSVWTDKHGLAQRADLSKTQAARELYEDIAAGNYSRMSFAFKVAADRYDSETHTRIIERIERVFDVSPVTWPANARTEIGVASRDYFSGVLADDRERQKIKIKIMTCI